MSDVTPTPPQVPAPSVLSRVFTALLPQFIAYSRKGLIWFSGLSATGVLELVKSVGNQQGWTEAQQLQWGNRMMLIQGIVLLVAKFWTDQITKEDQALKTGLPSPAPVQGLPPPKLRGEGD